MSESGARRIRVGRIAGVFGLRGELKVLTADATELRPGLTLTAVMAGDVERRITIRALRAHGRAVLVHFEGIDDAGAAAAFAKATLLADEPDLPPLAEGTYRDEQLVGMQVNDERLGALGEVRDVLHYPHADMLVIGERRLLVPMVQAYGVHVDAGRRSIATRLPEGFEEL